MNVPPGLPGDDPLRNGLCWHGWVLPLIAFAALPTMAIFRFAHRDLR